jgi:hypothetical protein
MRTISAVILSSAIVLSSCTRDETPPQIGMIRVNGDFAEHPHAIAGMVNQIQVEISDNESLSQAKLVVQSGLRHHAVHPPSTWFASEPIGEWSESITLNTTSPSDDLTFSLDIPWTASGTYTLMCAAVDDEGNMAEVASHFELINDSVPAIVATPVAPFPHEGNTLLADAGMTYMIEGNVIDLQGLALVRLAVLSSAHIPVWQNEFIVPGDNVFALDDQSFELPEEAGDYLLFIRAVNINGRHNEVRANLTIQ